jgi:hypothetical protein
MCVIARRFFLPLAKARTMTTRKAHEIKPGDRINGLEVFDTVRRTFGGFYIPMVDGTRIEVATLETTVITD